WTLDYANQLYTSTANAANLMIGSGHSITGITTSDANTLSELVTVIALDSGHWQVTGSSSGIINASFACAQGSSSCSFTSSKVNFTLATGNPTNAGDRLDFVTIAASNDQNMQKQLRFGSAASGFNNGRSRIQIASGAGF